MYSNIRSRPAIVLCLGSSGWGDEAVALACAEVLKRHGLPVQSMRGDPNDIADAWHTVRHAIVIDTRKSRHGVPGTIQKISRLASAIDAADVLGFRHEQNISRALQMGHNAAALPERLTLVSIEAVSFEWGAPPSDEVLRTLDPLTQIILEVINSTRAYRHLARAS